MPSTSSITTSVAPNEIIFQRSVIAADSRVPLDPESAQGGITVPGVKGRISLSNSGRRATWTPEDALPPGHHTLVVADLISSKRQRLEAQLEIPFFVAESAARIPASLRVESLAKLRIHALESERIGLEQRPTGKFIELMKAAHRKTGRPVALAFDAAGKPVASEKIFRKLLEARVRKFGKLHETLHARIAKAGAGSKIPVAIWLRSKEALATDQKSNKGATPRPSRQTQLRTVAIEKVTTAFCAMLQREQGSDLRC